MSRQDLSVEEISAVLAEIMDGNASEVETAGVLVALRTKGETVEEIEGLARTMRRFATPVDAGRDDLVDTAGTGGGRPTFNVSTTAALIAAGAGCAVAKHGNRSATGLSGSADLLEALGVRIDLKPDAVAQCIREVGFGFMFAPAHHSATRYVIRVRKELAVRTIFNFLGPLTNPAGATRQVIGVSDPALPGHDRGRAGPPGSPEGAGSVECRRSGRDEHVGDNARRRGRRRGAAPYEVSPEDVGLARAEPGAIGGGTPDANAATTAGSSPASPAPSATSRCSTPAPRSTSAAARSRCEEGVAAAAEAASTPGAAAASLDALTALTATLCDARMNVLDRIVDDTRDEVARRRERVPLARLEQAIASRPEGRPFQEALARPGVSLIAEHKRRSPSAGVIREGATVDRDRAGLRARLRGRAVDPHRAVPLRRLARRSARRRSRRPTCRSCARTSSSTPTSSTSRRPPAPTRSC